jgi:hypothetical protein
MIENPEFDPLGVGDANDVIYGRHDLLQSLV